MARYLNAKCRFCRREGAKLFSKGERCLSAKCPIDKKGAVPPGQHGHKGRRDPSDFGVHLRAKQKTKRTYGIAERQFRRYIKTLTKKKGEAGQTLFQILERRLDNVVYRLGFTPSRSLARHFISHRHVLVNNEKVDVSSYLVRPEELVTLDKKTQDSPAAKKMMSDKNYQAPTWLKRQGPIGKILNLPQKDVLKNEIDEQLIVEYYSR